MSLGEFFKRKMLYSIAISSALAVLMLVIMFLVLRIQEIDYIKSKVDVAFHFYSEKISAQLFIHSFYDLLIDPILLQPFENITPGTKAAVKSQEGVCIISDCE